MALTTLLSLSLGICCVAQIDLDQSVPADQLSLPMLLDQLDTANHQRYTISLAALQEEFPLRQQVHVATYYQKSADHHLLRLGEADFPIAITHLHTQGSGKTIYQISDDRCAVVLLAEIGDNAAMTTAIVERDCLY